MKLPSRRSSYNEVASRGHEPEQPPPVNYSCSAHGCPIVGSITTDGRNVCFVHYCVEPMNLWDGATSRIRRRVGMLQALQILRRPGLKTEDMALAEARRLVPNLDPQHDTRYKAQFAIENRLIEIGRGGQKSGDEDDLPPASPVPPAPNVVDMVRRLSTEHRMPT